MKCIKCGYDNDDSAKFCINCGTALPKPEPKQDASIFVELAEAYTGNLAAAKEIAAKNPNTIRSISEASLKWIRAKDSTLFQDGGKSEEGKPILNDLENTEKTLRDLDYEERIVVLMHCLEKMKPIQIAQMLHITEDEVLYYLQSAYAKNNPVQTAVPQDTPAEKKKAAKKKRPVRRPVKKEPRDANDGPKFLRRITWQTRIIIAVIAAIVIGTFIGIKNYAHDEYLRGTAYLEEGDYESAIEPLLNAKRYGGSEDAGLKLGDVYYDQENYTKALEEYLGCRQEKTEVQKALIRTYQKLAEEEIAASNYGNAASYLQSQYDLDQDEHTLIQLNAAQNGGTYTDDNGNVYNAWGDPEKLCAVKDGRTLYTIELIYHDDRTLKEMKEYTSSSSKVIYNQLGTGKDIEASWLPLKDGRIVYSVQTSVNDDHGSPTQITVTTSTSVLKTSCTYTYQDDQITSASIKSPDGTVKADYTYQDGRLAEITNSDSTVTTYEYDRNGWLIHETTVKENGDIVADTAYDYDDSGNVIEKIVKRQSIDGILPYSDNEDIIYTNRYDGSFSTMTVYAHDKEIAKGYYIENAGWIILYDTASE